MYAYLLSCLLEACRRESRGASPPETPLSRGILRTAQSPHRKVRVMIFTNIKQVKEAAKEAGNNWFDKDEMEYWGCIVYPTVFDGRYFISSEQGDYVWGKERRFTLRRIQMPDFDIRTIGVFGAYATYEEAQEALYELILVGKVLSK
jgi:hypothetical protein